MLQAIIMSSGEYSITSYGNGLAYELRYQDSYVFFQGDDADTFRNEMGAYQLIDCPNDSLMRILWADYADISSKDSD